MTLSVIWGCSEHLFSYYPNTWAILVKQALGIDDGQGSLGCCSPWNHKESDMTEQLNWKSRLTGTWLYRMLNCKKKQKIPREYVILGIFKIFFSKIFLELVIIQLNLLYLHCTKSLQSCPTLCDPVDHSPSGSTVHGFSRQEYWSGLPLPPPGDLPNPGINPRLLCL